MKVLVLLPLPLLFGCGVTLEKLNAVQAHVTTLEDGVKAGAKAAQAAVTAGKLLKEQAPLLKTTLPTLAAFADKITELGDMLLEKGQVALTATLKTQVALNEINTTITDMKSSIPVGGGSLKWYEVLIAVLGLGASVGRKVMTGGVA